MTVRDDNHRATIGEQVELLVGPVVERNYNPAILKWEETAVDLTEVGTTMRLNAKLRRTDATSEITVTEADTITLNEPSSAAKNYATAIIAAAESAGYTAETKLEYDVLMVHPTVGEKIVGRGRLTYELTAQ